MANHHTADPYGPTVTDRGTAEAPHRWSQLLKCNSFLEFAESSQKIAETQV